MSIEKQQLNNIATWMINEQQTKLPEILQGVFFMDGNPLPDDCLTMYDSRWDADRLILYLAVFAPRKWTFHDSIPGLILLRLVQFSQLIYEFQFEDETLRRAQITPVILGWRVPKQIADFSLCRENNSNGDSWQRRTSLLGGLIPNNYTLRRIVDKNGQYTPAFPDMLSKVNNKCLAIANQRMMS
ncbi:hypothetical protein [Lyngbya aestuarii]|uniref:hypothetical protein n=1 Tax=Lyngbya aestuarii TaxID=118322 RepID=UPI00403D9AF7